MKICRAEKYIKWLYIYMYIIITMWREIYIIITMCYKYACEQCCLVRLGLRSSWGGRVFGIIIVTVEIPFLLKCHHSQSAWAALTERHGQGGFNSRAHFSQFRTPEAEVPASGSGQSSLPGLGTATLCPRVALPRCVHVWRGSSGLSSSS